MEDAALGLAWVEMIEMRPDGRESISAAHPMFLTTRCDICDEMSSLFSGADLQGRRDMAGVLKVHTPPSHPTSPSHTRLPPPTHTPQSPTHPLMRIQVLT
jgi:hypothetical protein